MYKPLQRANDWGADYIGFAGKTLSPSGFADSQNYALRLQDGDRVRVRWPDGHESIEIILHQENNFSVNDMGHEYKGTYALPGFIAQIHGSNVWLPLDTVELWSDDE